MNTEAQKAAKKRKNPKNRSGYSRVLVHYKGVPCNSRSAYGLNITKLEGEVTCITCQRIIETDNLWSKGKDGEK